MNDITELAQSLKAAAEKATPGQWMAFTHADSQTFSVHTPDDKRCGDVIKWAGFDGQRKAKANAEFIALANPSNILALVEALEKAQQRIAELESRTVTAAAAAVLAERKRQVAAEGWTPGHDDEYEHGELADAAGCYALSSELFDCAGEPPRPWPWPDEWWKPTNRRRDLVKAGALILAEIERLDRASGIKVEAE
ncbi:TPA: ead/Ea22-like family protein [Klebsiella pneumoniae]